jgi:hypothetical protein
LLPVEQLRNQQEQQAAVSATTTEQSPNSNNRKEQSVKLTSISIERGYLQPFNNNQRIPSILRKILYSPKKKKKKKKKKKNEVK